MLFDSDWIWTAGLALLWSAHVLVEIGPTDPNEPWRDFNLAFTGSRPRNVIFDPDVLFAVEARGSLCSRRHFGKIGVSARGAAEGQTQSVEGFAKEGKGPKYKYCIWCLGTRT